VRACGTKWSYLIKTRNDRRIFRKIEDLFPCFPVSLEQFSADWGLQNIVERSLQVMIEVMTDIAERILAEKGVAPQKTTTETMRKLHELGII